MDVSVLAQRQVVVANQMEFTRLRVSYWILRMWRVCPYSLLIHATHGRGKLLVLGESKPQKKLAQHYRTQDEAGADEDFLEHAHGQSV